MLNYQGVNPAFQTQPYMLTFDKQGCPISPLVFPFDYSCSSYVPPKLPFHWYSPCSDTPPILLVLSAICPLVQIWCPHKQESNIMSLYISSVSSPMMISIHQIGGIDMWYIIGSITPWAVLKSPVYSGFYGVTQVGIIHDYPILSQSIMARVYEGTTLHPDPTRHPVAAALATGPHGGAPVGRQKPAPASSAATPGGPCGACSHGGWSHASYNIFPHGDIMGVYIYIIIYSVYIYSVYIYIAST